MFALRLSMFDNLVTLEVKPAWELQFTDGLLSLLNLDDGLHGTWLDAGTYKKDRTLSFADTRTLNVYLDQLSTTENFVSGAPSTWLADVGLGKYSYGDTITSRFENPQFKRLTCGCISDLKLSIRDDTGKIIDNHQQPISVVLEFAAKQ